MTISNKADHKRLPKPQGTRVSAAQGYVPPKTENERILARALAEVLKRRARLGRGPFLQGPRRAFAADGARSARRSGKNPRMSNVSMRDIYTQSDHREACATICDSADRGLRRDAAAEPFHVPSNLAYYGCGALQLAVLCGLRAARACGCSMPAYQWVDARPASPLELYVRSVVFAAGSFVALTAHLDRRQVAADRPLEGSSRSRSGASRYFRFWVVKTLMRTAPVTAFVGTPLYNVYLRLLGAKIGRNTVISSRLRARSAPTCSRIGDNTILRKDSILLGYRAQSNFIHIGPVEYRQQRLRRRSERARHRHRDGRRHPARSCLVAAKRPARAGRQALSRLARGGDDVRLLPDREHECAAAPHAPLLFLARARGSAPRRDPGADPALLACLGSAIRSATGEAGSQLRRCRRCRCSACRRPLFFGALVLGLAAIYVIPRLCHALPRSPARPMPIFGFHYLLQSMISRVSNSRFYMRAVRRQLGHRALHALRRLEPEQGRADRLELRHQPAARQSVPVRHRQRHDGLRRPVDDQHAHVGDSSFRLAKTRRSASATISATTSTIRRRPDRRELSCSAPRR